MNGPTPIGTDVTIFVDHGLDLHRPIEAHFLIRRSTRYRFRLAQQYDHDRVPHVAVAHIDEIEPWACIGQPDGPRLVALFDHPGDVCTMAAMQRWPGVAFLHVTSSPEQVGRAVEAVLDGAFMLPADLWPTTRWMAATVSGSIKRASTAADLSAREREVLTCLTDGLTNAEIAARLHVGISAIRYHIGNLLTKLGCQTRGELIVFAFRSGFAPPAADFGRDSA